jgi:hypothetical protein
MKKLYISLATVLLLLYGCNNNTDDFNNNQDAPYNVSAESLLTNAEKQLADQLTTPEVNFSPFRFFAQYWAQTTYNDESRYRLTSRRVSDNHWNSLYRDVLGSLVSAKEVIEKETIPTGVSLIDWQIQQANKLAIIEILNVYTFQVLVDTYGDVPYSEALNVNIKLPKYDDDALIYAELITRLNTAISQLDESGESFVTGEIIYGGDVNKWKILGNTVKLKLGINLADVNPTLAQNTVESAYNAGVILNNNENASFQYPSAAPNYNPIFAQLVASNRNDFVPSVTIVNKMNSLSDPRRDVYFTKKDGNFIGGINGAFNSPYSAFSQIGDVLKSASALGQYVEASEINFYLAEAAARGYSVGNSAEFYYHQAIQKSFEFWGIGSLSSGYIADPAVNYATAVGDWKQKIGQQEWIALYNRPFQGWTCFRRLDYPALTAPSNASSAADGVVPRRLAYPINERTVNTTNYENAVEAIGGFDRMRVKVFWDVN